MSRILYLIIIVALTQCSHKNRANDKEIFFENFKIKKISVLEHEDFVGVLLDGIYLFGETDSIVSLYNYEQKKIRILGIGKSSINDTLCLQNLFDKYHIENYLGHCFVNTDSIFILTNIMNNDSSRLNYFVFLLNMKGEIKNKWDISALTGIDNTYFCVKSLFQNRMSIKNDNIICMTDIHLRKSAKADVAEIPTELVLNIKTDLAYFIYAKPDLYGEGKYYGNHAKNHSKAFLNDTVFVLSFPVDHTIYKYNINGNLIDKKMCKSVYIDDFKDFEWSATMTINKIIEIQVTSPYYYQIQFDKENRLLYRIVLHEQDALNDAGDKNTVFDKSFSIIVMDEQLNIIGEYFVPPYHLCPYLLNTNLPGSPFMIMYQSESSKFIYVKYEYIDKRKK